MKFIRKHLGYTIALALMLAGAAGIAMAQNAGQFIASPVGTEAIQVYPVNTAANAYVALNTIRNTTGYLTTTVAGSTTIPANVNRYIITAQPAVATISLPASPVPDGSMVEVVNGTASAFSTNAVTLAPSAGQTLIGGNITLTTLAATTSVEVQYSLANTTWYRIR